jgi:hypothetical protein
MSNVGTDWRGLIVGDFLPTERAAVYCLERTRRGVIDCGDYLWQVVFDDG